MHLEFAPASPLLVTVVVNAPSLAIISSHPFLAGSDILMINFPADATSHAFYLQGLSTGMTYLTATASGYDDGNLDVFVDPSGFGILSPGSIDTTAGADTTEITICAYRLNPATLNPQELQNIRGGVFAAAPIVAANPDVGVVSPSPVNFNPKMGCADTQFDAVGPGNTNIDLTQPAGFDIPSSLQSIPVQVTP